MNRALHLGWIAPLGIVAVILLLPFLIPMSAYRGPIQGRASSATGRSVTIHGPLRLSIFPVLGLRAEQVSVANIPGGAHRELANADALQLAVRIAPLLAGRIEVSDIKLVHPAIHLEVDSKGRANWSVAAPGGSARSHGPSVEFQHIAIEDGSLTFTNAKTGAERSVEHVNADLSMPENGKLSSRGDLELRGQRINFDVALDDMRAMAAGRTSPARINVGSNLFQAGFVGRIEPDGDADGDLRVATSSFRKLAELLGDRISTRDGFGQFHLTSHFKSDDKVYALSDATLVLDEINASGRLTVDERGDIPSFRGVLTADRLDLNPYLGGGAGKEAGEEGWSRKPISMALLKDANADLTLSTGMLAIRKLRLANAHLTVSLASGRLDANLDRIALYGGQGEAELKADVSGAEPEFENQLSFRNIGMSRFLADTIGVGRIEGSGSIQLNVRSHGQTADVLMRSLEGSGAVAIRDGIIRGVDLGVVVRTVQTMLSGGAVSESATTGFSRFGGTFRIRDGVLDNRNLSLTGPVLAMTGHGELDLGNRTIDFHVVPKASVGGGPLKSLGVAVPVHITGSWNHLHYTPELAGAVTGIIGGVLQGGGSALTDLVGNPGSSRRNKSSLSDSVKGLFGIH
ncbi:MAG: AsmA family protein [Alphaproteobacteria bacterium]|nr:AsmA family protein [Alphaproteobacteria bacterium]